MKLPKMKTTITRKDTFAKVLIEFDNIRAYCTFRRDIKATDVEVLKLKYRLAHLPFPKHLFE